VLLSNTVAFQRKGGVAAAGCLDLPIGPTSNSQTPWRKINKIHTNTAFFAVVYRDVSTQTHKCWWLQWYFSFWNHIQFQFLYFFLTVIPHKHDFSIVSRKQVFSLHSSKCRPIMMTFGRYISCCVEYTCGFSITLTCVVPWQTKTTLFLSRVHLSVRPSNASIASKRMNISSNIFDGLVAETSLHCALASGAMYNYIVIGPLCVCACVCVAGGRCPNLTTASARSVCVSLSAFFILHLFYVLSCLIDKPAKEWERITDEQYS